MKLYEDRDEFLNDFPEDIEFPHTKVADDLDNLVKFSNLMTVFVTLLTSKQSKYMSGVVLNEFNPVTASFGLIRNVMPLLFILSIQIT